MLKMTRIKSANIAAVNEIVRNTTQEEVIENRRNASTRNQYNTRIARMIRIIREKHPTVRDLIGEGNMLKRHVPMNIMNTLIEEFNKRDLGNSMSTFVSNSAFGGFVSTFKYWHQISDEKRTGNTLPIILPKEHEDRLKKFTEGRKRKIASLRQDGLLPSREGKSFLMFSSYKWLAKTALKDENHQYAHCYLILAWNMIARSHTVAPLLWKNIGWVDDCLTIKYDTSKTNQTGETIFPRHIYANPFEPCICPILALGIKLLVDSHTGTTPAKLFPGEADKNFCAWLGKIIKNPTNEDDLAYLGTDPEEIGTHSLRKGAATYVCGLTEGPQSDTIKLRMDHTIGKVDDKYFNIQAGADKLVGRCVTGLNLNSLDITVLPPLFIDMEGVDFDKVLPHGNIKSASPSLKLAIPFLIASVVFHWDWIKANLPSNHKIFSSKFATGNFGELWRSKVQLSLNKCPHTGMVAQSVPKVIQMMFILNEISRKLNCTCEAVMNKIDDATDHTVSSLMNKLGTVHGIEVANNEVIKEVCHDEMAAFSRQLARFENIMKAMQSEIAKIRNPESSSGENQPNRDGYRAYSWGGCFHMVPENFIIPQDTPMALWRLWIYGDLSKDIGPFRLIKSYSLSKSQKCQLSKVKKVMETIMASMDKSYEEVQNMDREECEALFFQHYRNLVGDLRNIDRNNTSTAYEFIREKDKNNQRNEH